MNTREVASIAVIVVGLILLRFLALWYPVSSGKDWLDIISSLGEAFGILALFALVYEVLRDREEQKEKYTPKIQVYTPAVTPALSVPDDGVCCLCEDSDRELPSPSLGEYRDYRELYYLLGDNRDSFIKIGLRNAQDEVGADARELELEIQVDYHRSEEAARAEQMPSTTKRFWAPPFPFHLPAGEKRSLYIRCGELDNVDTDYVSGAVLGWKCENARGEKFSSVDIEFTPVKLPGQALVPPSTTRESSER